MNNYENNYELQNFNVVWSIYDLHDMIDTYCSIFLGTTKIYGRTDLQYIRYKIINECERLGYNLMAEYFSDMSTIFDRRDMFRYVKKLNKNHYKIMYGEFYLPMSVI